MNERIDKLFEQALEEFTAENKYATIIVPNPLKEKFAKLIVRECMDECLRMQLGNQYTPEELLFQTKYRKIIKEHFGVEE
jgi:hypothetical protein